MAQSHMRSVYTRTTAAPRLPPGSRCTAQERRCGRCAARSCYAMWTFVRCMFSVARCLFTVVRARLHVASCTFHVARSLSSCCLTRARIFVCWTRTCVPLALANSPAYPLCVTPCGVPTSALRLVHICAANRPHLRWDSSTSALGLVHICAGTRPHLPRARPQHPHLRRDRIASSFY